MLLHRITTVKELLEFAPLVFDYAENHDPRGHFRQEPGVNFADRFFSLFHGGYYYGGISKGKLDYFCAVVPTGTEGVALAWLFYVDLDNYMETSELIAQIKDNLRGYGVKEMYFSTTRLTSSYKRWAEKHGAKQVSITYKVEI